MCDNTAGLRVGLTLWPSWLECWVATLSVVSAQVRNPLEIVMALNCRYTEFNDVNLSTLKVISYIKSPNLKSIALMGTSHTSR